MPPVFVGVTIVTSATIILESLLSRHGIIVTPPGALWMVLGASLRVNLAVLSYVWLVHIRVRLHVDPFDADARHILPVIVLNIARHCSHLRLLSLVRLLSNLRESMLMATERVIDESFVVFVVLREQMLLIVNIPRHFRLQFFFLFFLGVDFGRLLDAD